jgi:predicted unusual protein kinase regulating ubiquinone biosynthesis (AarF/ABC1/UbiB family)
VLRAWMHERISPQTMLRRLRQQLPDILQAAKLLPQVFQNIVRESAEGRFPLQISLPEIEQLRAEINRGNARRDAALLMLALWAVGSTWLLFGKSLPGIGWGLIAAGAAVMAAGFLRSRRIGGRPTGA